MVLQGAAELRSSAPLLLEVSADMAQQERQVRHQTHKISRWYLYHMQTCA